MIGCNNGCSPLGVPGALLLNPAPNTQSVGEVSVLLVPDPPCPRCGNLVCEKLSERRADLSCRLFDKPDGSAKESIYVFRCDCGWTFTHSVKYGELGRKAAEVWRRDMASNWRKNRGIELMQLWQEIPDKMILRYRSIEGIDPSAPLPPRLTTARLIDAILDDEQRQKRSAVFASN
jgi:hypothetical protein